MDGSQVLLGNCFDLFQAIPDGIAQMTFVDPPYNIGVDYGNGKAADSLPADEYLRQMQSLISECTRVLNATGSLWFLCPERWADPIGTMLSAAMPRRNRIVWRETFGQYREERFPNGHRHLFWHVKDERASPFFTDEIRVRSKRMEAGDSRAAGPRVPDDVWEIPRLVGTAAERIEGHPCQLPEDLLERVILCSTRPGHLVIDPMTGTGTTLRVAQRLGRRYLGIEEQPGFVALIESRLQRDYQRALFSA